MKKLATAYRVLTEQGLRSFVARSRSSVASLVKKGHRYEPVPVREAHLLGADFTRNTFVQRKITAKTLSLNWVMPPPGPGSGGHTTLSRLIGYLESKGHSCRIYLYNAKGTLPSYREMFAEHFPPMKAEISLNVDSMEECDIVFATSWETAYPVYCFNGARQKFYLVQDFEPFFHPVGSISQLAENTYRFGFTGITAGGWLTSKLEREFGMRCYSFNFGSDPEIYRFENVNERKRILFYARPRTPRRGFELGILALKVFNAMHPDHEIDMIGSDVSDYDMPFRYRNLGTVPHRELNRVYNDCAAALVLSLTNMSLLPLELLAAGCVPVLNQGPNNRMVSDNPFIAYAEPTPHELARALSAIVTMDKLPEYARRASQSVRSLEWAAAGEQMVRILEQTSDCSA